MRRHEVFETARYALWRRGQRHIGRARVIYLEVHDRYSGLRYRWERQAITLTARVFERTLRHYPALQFDSPRNMVRKMLYVPKTMRIWARNMPNGFSTFPVHNPEAKRLHTGERVGFITKKVFRHSADGIGLRSRAHVMSWWVYEHASHKKRLRWLSIAAGSGQPTFDAVELYDIQPIVYLSDLSQEALHFAESLATNRGLDMSQVHTTVCDATNQKSLKHLLSEARPDVIDIMGLFEYLSEDTIVTILKTLTKSTRQGSFICFTNMRPEHPQLQLHKRGLGWPGVTVRTIDDVLMLIKKAGISLERVEVLLPSDRVYAVYCIK